MDFSNIKETLFAEYPCRIEMHCHSNPASGCSDVSPEELVDIYHGAGYDALCLTNHFLTSLMDRGGIDLFLDDYERAAARAERYGMKIYLGAELRFDEKINDYLLYGVDREILERAKEYLEKGLAAYVHEAKDARSVLAQAHPFRKNMVECDPSLLDGIEAWNFHSGHNSAPATALHHAILHHKEILTAGTDFHHPSRQHPCVALRVKSLPADSFALAALLRSGDFFYELEEKSVILP